MIGIGIDTGGTCTDAVVYEQETKRILYSAKSPTTHEQLEIGIRNSLRKIPQAIIRQASYVSLSTTLATNACVENKGGNVCLIFIGVDPRTVERTWRDYGFESMSFMRFLNADPKRGIEPDWAFFERMLPELLTEYDSFAVSQMMARENNGAYEKKAGEILRKATDKPVVCAYEIFKDLNVIKRGAGALLNARLIPVIDRFFAAVKTVLKEEGISLPFVIMRSDGSLVSEEYSRMFPVETLLCGPTASAKGGLALMPEQSAVLIDMGGTTSDIALIKDGEPVIDPDGVKVGGWQTFVRGIDIDTFALGGDSHVCCRRGRLELGDRRVMPVSELVKEAPQILDELERRAATAAKSPLPLFEHLIRMQDLTGREERYSEEEQIIVEMLADGPLSGAEIARRLGKDPYMLKTERLEKEGILLRSGFTPTDAMVLLGDRMPETERKAEVTPESRAAALAAECLSKMAYAEEPANPLRIAETVYTLVKEKLYCSLVRILWKDAQKGSGKEAEQKLLLQLAKECFVREMAGDQSGFFYPVFHTDAVLLGVGAPIHVFLPDVAKALHTTCRVSEHSGVCNALGAVLGDVTAYETVSVKAEYLISSWDEEGTGYIVYGDEVKRFGDLEKAHAWAEETAKRRAREKALKCGAKSIHELTAAVKVRKGESGGGMIYLGSEVTACARGSWQA